MVSFSYDGQSVYVPVANKVVRYAMSDLDSPETVIVLGSEAALMVTPSFDDKMLFVFSRSYNKNFLRVVDPCNADVIETVEVAS